MSSLYTRLREPSTRVGLVFLLGTLGHHVSPETVDQGIEALLLLISLYEIIRKEYLHKE
jgi:hypothetical protein